MPLRRTLAGEVEEVLDDPPRPIGLLEQDVGVVPHVVRQPLVTAEERAVADDRGERVVQLVGNAGDEHPDRLHLLGLDELALMALLLGEVADPHEDAPPRSDRQGGHAGLRGERRAIKPSALDPHGQPPLAFQGGRDRRLVKPLGYPELFRGVAGKGARLEPEQPSRRRVRIEDRPVGREHEGGIRRLIEQCSVELLGGDEIRPQAPLIVALSHRAILRLRIATPACADRR